MPPAKTTSISWLQMNDRQAVVRATLIVSVLSLLVSWVLTGGLMWLLATTAGPREWLVAAVVTTIAPLLVAPPMAYKSFDLMRQLVESRREVERLSQNDELTGAHNRRYFMEIAQRELGLAQRSGQAVGLLLLDLDGFKQINDQMGHLAGDRALAACAAAIQAGIRQGDVLGRFGGDEFLVLAPNTGLEAAARLAERVREAVAQARIVLPEGTVRLGASLGVVSNEQGVHGADELLGLADRALYRAKDMGGDRIELAAA
ncbi:MAG: GGDEF domain-containing protein [Desulfarculaceae bacterium]|nr:GGDEF domain-containing protein [Desulfarculaceae bacterium]